LSAAAPCPGCEGERTQTFQVEGLDCATEVALVEGSLRALPGVCSVRASAVTGQATVVHTLEPGAIERALGAAGLRARSARSEAGPPASLLRTLAALALTTTGFAVGFAFPAWAVAPYFAAIVIGGYAIAGKGLARARRRVLDVNALMTVAVLGAMAIGEWAEGAVTVLLFSLAQLLETRSLERARKAIASLMTLAPERALVRGDGREERVPAGAVSPGQTILVAPHERFPLDGIVLEGTSEVDQSPLTGESRAVEKAPGQEVFAGSINGSGLLAVRVTRASSETTLARIIRRVEEAQASRAPSQGFVERFARVYTPVVVGLAVLVAALPPLAGQGALADWTYRALVLLVISCPCALVISTPVSIVSALTAASRRGVLVKGGAHLEALARVRTVAFDKTGTLTWGKPEVTDVRPARGRTVTELLRLASSLESRSGHPVARAVVARARREGIEAGEVTDLTAIPGRGVGGRVDGREALVGSHRLFDERGLCDHELDEELARFEAEGKTAILVGTDGTEPSLVGLLAVADAVRLEAAPAVRELGRDGIHVVMLTGDNRRTADALAGRLGISEGRADLLPEGKVAVIRELERGRGPVAMVGDGVNDAPALATATVGVAMGGRGTDAALETADVALMSDDLTRIPYVIRLGRATRRIIVQNITISLSVKGLVLALALAGYGSLWAAVGADMGASLLVIGNGLRLLHDRAPRR
jgi:Cd2+/Zn2+-exporting ATPase